MEVVDLTDELGPDQALEVYLLIDARGFSLMLPIARVVGAGAVRAHDALALLGLTSHRASRMTETTEAHPQRSIERRGSFSISN